MRILVTNLGNGAVRDLSTDYTKFQSTKLKEEDENFRSTQAMNFNKSQYASKKNKGHVNNNTSYANLNAESSMISIANSTQGSFIKKAKEVDINIKKITLNRQSNEKYNLDTKVANDSLILPSLPEKLLKKLEKNDAEKQLNNSSNDSIGGLERKSSKNVKIDVDLYSIADILPEETIKDMISTYKSKIRMHDKLAYVSTNQFRTPYLPQSKAKQVMNTLEDTVIASTNSNMIQYLGEKDKVSEIFIEKLHKTDSQSQMRLNRVCQRVFRNNTLDELRNHIISKKIQANSNKEKINYFEKIKLMKSELSEGKDILEKYMNRKEVNKQEIFEDRMTMVKNHWQKLNVNRFYHKKKNASQDIRSGYIGYLLDHINMDSGLYSSLDKKNSFFTNKSSFNQLKFE